jgi:UDP-glucose 4-epimerase
MKKETTNVLITGGAGFIGSHLVDKLIEVFGDNVSITVIDDLRTGDLKNLQKSLKKINLIINNIHNADNIYFNQYDVIYHLAADARVPYCSNYPLESNFNNVIITLELLEFCRLSQKNLKRFVFASSSAIYGNVDSNCFPTNELVPPNPLSNYALQKLTAETYCELYRKNFGLPTVSLRFFNVFGERQNGSGPYSNIISSWATKAVKNHPVRLDGTGEQSRDFIYVKDVVNALYLSGFGEKKAEGIYNIGSGESHSVNEIKEIFTRHFPNLKIENSPPRLGDVEKTLSDSSKFIKLFNEFKLTNFYESLNKTIEWYKERYSEK